MDACAMIAILANEPGADIVDAVYDKAATGEAELSMNIVNLFEVYYDLVRSYGVERANEIYNEITSLPISIINEISNAVFKEAGRLKTTYKISLADSIALAQALTTGSDLLTSDHHEFDKIKGLEPINFCWIR